MNKALIIGLMLLSVPASAEVARAKLVEALAGYERPVTQATLEALGDGWQDAVISLVRDEKAPALYRVRGLAALSFVKTPAASKALRDVIAAKRAETEGAGVLEVRQAVRALALVDGEKAGPVVQPLLAHKVADVREAAAYALAESNAPGAKAALLERIGKEPEGFVREAIERAIKGMK